MMNDGNMARFKIACIELCFIECKNKKQNENILKYTKSTIKDEIAEWRPAFSMKSLNMVKRVIWELEAILHFVNSKRLSHIPWICNLFRTNPKIVKLFVFLILAMAGTSRTPAQSLCIHTMMHHFSALSLRVRFFCSLRFGWMFLNHMQHIINVHTGKCGFSFWAKAWLVFFSFR